MNSDSSVPAEFEKRVGTHARALFAIWPDGDARAALAMLAARTAMSGGGRAIPAQDLHVTVAFVGVVALPRLAALRDVGAFVAAAVAPFDVVLDGPGRFRDGALAWIGSTDVPRELARTAQLLAEGLVREGFRVERRTFRAHLTLARDCTLARVDSSTTRIAWRAREITLTESKLGRGVPVYRDIARWTLAARK